ncbi:hypothetical protein [Polymorphospora rubra]|uniref:hypothetical protein n=1 Tax=Polymorphospora rubra TaxID=338584 RepID=UPI0033F222BB
MTSAPGTTSRRMRVRVSAPPVLAVSLVVALIGTGCSRDEPAAPSTMSSASVSSTPGLGPDAVAEEGVLAAYRGMWDAFVEAGKVSDPDAAGLRRYASDQALRLVVSSLYTNREQGKVAQGAVVLSPEVIEITPPGAPTEATVLDCVDSTNWLEYKASGGLWDDEPGGRHRTTATVKATDGVWRVSSFILEESGTC